MCRPRLRWTLQHSSQRRTPWLIEHHSGPDEEEEIPIPSHWQEHSYWPCCPQSWHSLFVASEVFGMIVSLNHLEENIRAIVFAVGESTNESVGVWWIDLHLFSCMNKSEKRTKQNKERKRKRKDDKIVHRGGKEEHHVDRTVDHQRILLNRCCHSQRSLLSLASRLQRRTSRMFALNRIYIYVYMYIYVCVGVLQGDLPMKRVCAAVRWKRRVYVHRWEKWNTKRERRRPDVSRWCYCRRVRF